MKHHGVAVAILAVLASVAPAVPLRKREVVWVTEYVQIVETIAATQTVWVTATPTSTSLASSTSASSSAVEVASTTSEALVAVSSLLTSYTTSLTPSTTSASDAATTSSISIATTTPSAVSSTTSTPITSSTSTAASATSTSTVYTGDMTYYDVGLGSCGWTSSPSDSVVALSHLYMDNPANPNNNPLCGRTISISYGGKQTQAEVVDTCEGCSIESIDMSDSLFEYFEDLSVGRVSGVEWWFD